ncbi:acyclic terpene utilization AtuA family protein [Actinokineospora sp. 24-640]
MIRIANISGFYGDRLSAMREMLDGGEVDVLTGDYLAELTMLILGRQRMKDPSAGYARTFLKQAEDCLGTAVERGVRIVVNAGGLNPAGLADAVRALGVTASVSHVEGDDLLPRAGELGLTGALTANAYLGGWGIASCLRAGADVVVTGRVTDASLVVGAAAAHFGWATDDYDALAGATVAGHVIECGTQATGGNYSFFTEIESMDHPGFPIAEIHADGSSVITKHPGTGGAVTVETVTAQLLYEIQGPNYLGPDVTTRFDTITLTPDGADRVRVTDVKGTPPPPEVKVCVNTLDGFRNSATFILTGLDIDAKAALVRRQLEATVGKVTWTLARTDRPDADTEETASAFLHATIRTPDPAHAKTFSRAAVELALASYPGFTLTAPPTDGTPVGVYHPAYLPRAEVPHTAVHPNGTHVPIPWPEAPTTPDKAPETPAHDTPDPQTLPGNPPSRALLRPENPEANPQVHTASQPEDPQANPQGHTNSQPENPQTSPQTHAPQPGNPQVNAQNHAASPPRNPHQPSPTAPWGVGPAPGYPRSGGAELATAELWITRSAVDGGLTSPSGVATRRCALGEVVGARSGDKGGDANLGVWVREARAYPWLVAELTVERLKELLPEAAGLSVERYELPNLLAVNFVLKGLLGQGVAAGTRFDPQAKGLGEWLRSRCVEVPEVLL